TGSDRADADLRHELHAHPRAWVDVLQIVDQLRQVLDRIDVVVWGGRNESHARGGVAHLGDRLAHLVTGQLAAFAGLGALRDLDLQIAGVEQILRRYA